MCHFSFVFLNGLQKNVATFCWITTEHCVVDIITFVLMVKWPYNVLKRDWYLVADPR